jgi:hypothetical protein
MFELEQYLDFNLTSEQACAVHRLYEYPFDWRQNQLERKGNTPIGSRTVFFIDARVIDARRGSIRWSGVNSYK